MMAQDLITSIRYKVGDTKSTKWDNDRIIDLLNEGLEDIAKKASIKKVDISLPILPYQRELVIPNDDVIDIISVKILGSEVQLITFDELINIPDWYNTTGEKIRYIAFTKQNIKHLTLYPLLTEASTNYENLLESSGLVIDIPGVDRDSLYGIITSLDVAQNIITPENIWEQQDLSGGLTTVSDNFVIATIRYKAIPNKVLSVTDTIDLDTSYKQALIYYVSGMLLLDDNRAESVAKGTQFINKYEVETKELRDRTVNSNQAFTGLNTDYRTGFEY